MYFWNVNNQPYMTRSAHIDLNPGKYYQRLSYYPFVVNLDRCNESCNTLNDFSDRMCSKQNM